MNGTTWKGDLHELSGLRNLEFSTCCFHHVDDEEKPPTVLGKGGFGVAYLGVFSSRWLDKCAIDPHLKAVMQTPMVVKRQELTNRVASIQREVSTLRKLSKAASALLPQQKPIVVALGFFVARNKLHHHLVMEYAPGSDLYTILRTIQLTTDQLKCLGKQCLESVSFVHGCNFIHRDIKPQNCLLNAYGKVVLADFGLSMRTEDLKKKTPLCGTTMYMSPEVRRRDENVSHLVDIYGVGVIVFFALTRSVPGLSLIEYRNYNKKISKVDNAQRVQLRNEIVKLLNERQETRDTCLHYSRRLFPQFDTLDGDFAELLASMIDPDPSTRSDARELLSHLHSINSTFSDNDLRGFGAFDEVNKYRKTFQLEKPRLDKRKYASQGRAMVRRKSDASTVAGTSVETGETLDEPSDQGWAGFQRENPDRSEEWKTVILDAIEETEVERDSFRTNNDPPTTSNKTDSDQKHRENIKDIVVLRPSQEKSDIEASFTKISYSTEGRHVECTPWQCPVQ